jgi:hypothetical protein
MHAFLTKPGRWIYIVAVALLMGETARGDDAAAVKEVTVPDKGDVNVDFALGITGLPEY